MMKKRASLRDETMSTHGTTRIGILTLQGDFEPHFAALKHLGVEAASVRTPDALADLHGLVMPGGESNTLPKSARERLATWAKPMLFDLDADPATENNLADANGNILPDLRGKFVDFLADCGTAPDFVEKW